jgi:hypothetical protein
LLSNMPSFIILKDYITAQPSPKYDVKNSSCQLKILVIVFGDMPSRSQGRRGPQV